MRSLCFLMAFTLPLFFHCLAVSAPEMAKYPHPLPNSDICGDLKLDANRLFPYNEWACGGVDGHVFWRALGSEEFYHGFSYWLQGRAQFQPNENFRINLRSVLFSGSVSYGYTLPTGFYNVVGFSGVWPELIAGGELKARVMDLERQTIGAGLFIEEVDSAGLRLDWSNSGWNIKLMGEGTGMLLLHEDTINFEVNYLRWIGLGNIWWTESGDKIRRKHLTYLYSLYDWTENFWSKFEVGQRNQKLAGLLAIGGSASRDDWVFESSLQGRWYEDGIGSDFVGFIQNLYISYDQLSKPFATAKNLFVVDDNAYVYSAQLNATYRWSERMQFFSLNEVGAFQFLDRDTEKFWYTKYGVKFLPSKNRDDSLTLFGSNKVLSDSLAWPPHLISTANVQLFKQIDYMGIEAMFRF